MNIQNKRTAEVICQQLNELAVGKITVNDLSDEQLKALIRFVWDSDLLDEFLNNAVLAVVRSKLG